MLSEIFVFVFFYFFFMINKIIINGARVHVLHIKFDVDASAGSLDRSPEFGRLNWLTAVRRRRSDDSIRTTKNVNTFKKIKTKKRTEQNDLVHVT